MLAAPAAAGLAAGSGRDDPASGGVTSYSTAGTVGSGPCPIGVRGATGLDDWSVRFENLPDARAGDFFDGTVLLRPRAAAGVAASAGLPGLGAPLECRECLDDVERFRRILPSLATLSAPALALDADLDRPLCRAILGVTGVAWGGVPC